MSESEIIPHDFDDDHDKRGEQMFALAAELGCVENQTMSQLRNELKTVEDYDRAVPIFIRYQELGEAEITRIGQELSDPEKAISKTDQATSGILAQLGSIIGMAALFLENRRFIELEEHFYNELDTVDTIATNYEDILDEGGFLGQIDAIFPQVSPWASSKN